MARQINARTEELIKGFEKLKLQTYKDSAGVPTIGWGHTGPDVKMGQTITPDQAEAMFRKDVSRFEAAVGRLVKVRLTDNHFGALVSFAFNAGEEALQGSTLLKRLNRGEYDAVPSELMKWNKATVRGKKIVLAGLTRRRAAEAALFVESEMADRAEPAPASIAVAAPRSTAAVAVTSPTNWAAGALVGIPAAATTIKGVADGVNSTFTQVNDSVGAVKNGVTVIRDTTGTWLGWAGWHLSPVVMAALGGIALIGLGIVIWRHTQIKRDVVT